jgi:hypothetical protein
MSCLLQVKTMNVPGTFYRFNLEGTVLDLKKEIERVEGFPALLQRLCFQGVSLDENGKPLSTYGLRNKSSIYLYMKRP